MSTPRDLVLSSGFLAFARHTGVVQAIEAAGLPIDAVVGTSSGALVGALWAAGLSGAELEKLLQSRQPWQLLRLHPRPWQGALSMAGLIAFLRPHLPETFAQLPRPLAVGVADGGGHHRLLTEGPLAEAVAASCAMPYVFAPVGVNGTRYRDGGAADRLGLEAWRAWRPGRRALAHQVARTAGVDVPADLEGVTLVQTPRSGASFFSLGDFAGQVGEARAIADRSIGTFPGATCA